MGVEKLQQNLFTNLFKTITRKEQEVLQREVEECQNESGNHDDSILPKSVKKHHVGHPRKFVVTLQFERQIKKEANKKEDVDNHEGNKSKRQKSKRTIHKLVSATFKGTHNGNNPKIWSKC